MAKDLAYAINAASDKGVPLPVTTASLSVFRQAMELSYGGEDFAAVIKSAQKQRKT
jgi:3-hydroxyisobutyrate dehydrogenase-like beta-hydroxyacid dehydrogenase